MQTKAARQKPKRVNLTKQVIDRLKPPPAGRSYIYDDRQPGLALCVTAADSRTWYVYSKVDGKPVRYLLGKWPILTVENAREKAKAYSGRVAVGDDPNAARQARRNAPTLAEVFATYIEAPTRTNPKRPKSPKTVKEYRQLWSAYLQPWHHRQLSTINRADVEQLHNKLSKSSGIFTANRVLGLLKSLFNYAIDAELFTANPAARVLAFEEQSRERFIQADEFPRFWAALEAESPLVSDRIRDALKLLLLTGQRRSNVLGMRWADLNLSQRIWTIPQTKTGRHIVPLTAEAMAILKRREQERNGSEWVFPAHHGSSDHVTDPMTAWRDILKRAGLQNLRPHDLRRTLASWQTIGGSSLAVTGKLLGHSQPQTTAIYGRLDLEPVRAAAEAATSAMLATTKPTKRRKAVAK